MNTPAPESLVQNRNPEPLQSVKTMLPWPPEVTWAFGHSPVVERGDMVVAAELLTPAAGVIALRMCKKADGQEYGIELSLPAVAAEGVLQSIRPGMTLAEVGELATATTPAAQEAAMPPLA